MDKPQSKDLKVPWVAVDCFCGDAPACNMCDKFGWYYRNQDTGDIVSELVAGAMDRHG